MNEINAITEEDIIFMECFYTPQCLAECLFSDGDDLTSFEEDKFLELRTGQIPLLSFEYLIDYEASGLTRKQGMELRKGAGNIYCFGGRNYGKTFCVEKLDIILSFLCLDAQQMGFSSYDFSHIRGVLLPLIDVLEHHPFVKHWKKSITASPDYVIRTLNGNQLNSVNMNVSGKNPGHQFFQKHLHKLYIEEASFETEEVNRRRIDSKHEIGCVERLSGMTNFTRFSPAGKIFYSEDPKIQTQVCNLPQFVNPNFDEAENKAVIKKHGGKLSLGYRVFVKGEIVTEAISTFDMDKVRVCYNDKKEIKMMEVDKTTYQLMKEILIVEKPKNVDEVFIVADIGESAPTEILIIFKIGERYKYEYNIVLHNLDYKQQFKIFDYLAEQFGKAYFGIDCGDGSIDENELLPFRLNGKLNYCRAKELEDMNVSEKSLEAPTWNNGKLEWKPAEVFKHHYKGKMIEFKINPSSGSIKVTPNHSMMIYENGELISKRADEVKLNDWVASPKNLLTSKRVSTKIKCNILKRKMSIKVNEDFAYLLGWCVAEGCSKTTNYQLCLGNERPYAEELLKLSRKIFDIKSGYILEIDKTHCPKRKFKKGWISCKVKTYNVIIGGGTGVLNLIASLIGSGAKNKKIPKEILNASKSVKRAFLKGLIQGDGHERRRLGKSKEYSIHVISEKLIYGVSLLLKDLGFFGTFGSSNEGYNTAYTVSWTDTPLIGRCRGIPYNCIPMKNGKARINKKVYSFRGLIRNRVSKTKKNRIKEMLEYDYYFRKITSIKKYDYDGFVYDLMVKDNNTFIAGKGDVLIHNTGRAVALNIEKKYGNERLVRYQGASKIAVDVETEEVDGKTIPKIRDGEPVFTHELMSDWAIHVLRNLFYGQNIEIPLDYKFIKQFTSVVSIMSGESIKYKCVLEDNHQFDAWKVFANTIWQYTFSYAEDYGDWGDQDDGWGTGV